MPGLATTPSLAGVEKGAPASSEKADEKGEG